MSGIVAGVQGRAVIYKAHCKHLGIRPNTAVLKLLSNVDIDPSVVASTLDLSNLMLGDLGLLAVVDIVAFHFPTLRFIRLNDNGLYDKSAAVVARALRFIPSLIAVDLSNNHFTQAAIPTFKSWHKGHGVSILLNGNTSCFDSSIRSLSATTTNTNDGTTSAAAGNRKDADEAAAADALLTSPEEFIEKRRVALATALGRMGLKVRSRATHETLHIVLHLSAPTHGDPFRTEALALQSDILPEVNRLLEGQAVFHLSGAAADMFPIDAQTKRWRRCSLSLTCDVLLMLNDAPFYAAEHVVDWQAAQSRGFSSVAPLMYTRCISHVPEIFRSTFRPPEAPSGADSLVAWAKQLNPSLCCRYAAGYVGASMDDGRPLLDLSASSSRGLTFSHVLKSDLLVIAKHMLSASARRPATPWIPLDPEAPVETPCEGALRPWMDALVAKMASADDKSVFAIEAPHGGGKSHALRSLFEILRREKAKCVSILHRALDTNGNIGRSLLQILKRLGLSQIEVAASFSPAQQWDAFLATLKEWKEASNTGGARVPPVPSYADAVYILIDDDDSFDLASAASIAPRGLLQVRRADGTLAPLRFVVTRSMSSIAYAPFIYRCTVPSFDMADAERLIRNAWPSGGRCPLLPASLTAVAAYITSRARDGLLPKYLQLAAVELSQLSEGVTAMNIAERLPGTLAELTELQLRNACGDGVTSPRADMGRVVLALAACFPRGLPSAGLLTAVLARVAQKQQQQNNQSRSTTEAARRAGEALSRRGAVSAAPWSALVALCSSFPGLVHYSGDANTPFSFASVLARDTCRHLAATSTPAESSSLLEHSVYDALRGVSYRPQSAFSSEGVSLLPREWYLKHFSPQLLVNCMRTPEGAMALVDALASSTASSDNSRLAVYRWFLGAPSRVAELIRRPLLSLTAPAALDYPKATSSIDGNPLRADLDELFARFPCARLRPLASLGSVSPAVDKLAAGRMVAVLWGRMSTELHIRLVGHDSDGTNPSMREAVYTIVSADFVSDVAKNLSVIVMDHDPWTTFVAVVRPKGVEILRVVGLGETKVDLVHRWATPGGSDAVVNLIDAFPHGKHLCIATASKESTGVIRSFLHPSSPATGDPAAPLLLEGLEGSAHALSISGGAQKIVACTITGKVCVWGSPLSPCPGTLLAITNITGIVRSVAFCGADEVQVNTMTAVSVWNHVTSSLKSLITVTTTSPNPGFAHVAPSHVAGPVVGIAGSVFYFCDDSCGAVTRYDADALQWTATAAPAEEDDEALVPVAFGARLVLLAGKASGALVAFDTATRSTTPLAQASFLPSPSDTPPASLTVADAGNAIVATSQSPLLYDTTLSTTAVSAAVLSCFDGSRSFVVSMATRGGETSVPGATTQLGTYEYIEGPNILPLDPNAAW